RADPRPLSERLGRGRTEDVQISTRELETSVARVDLGSWHRPDRWLPRAVPSNQDRTGRGGVPEAIGVVLAKRPPRLAVFHRRATEERVQASGQVLRDLSGTGFVRQPPESEDGYIPSRDDIRVVTRSPELDQRRVSQRRRLGPRDARMDGEERSARHAVLQPRPR